MSLREDRGGMGEGGPAVVDSIPTSDNLTADDLATQADTMRTRLHKRADVLVDDPIITGEG